MESGERHQPERERDGEKMQNLGRCKLCGLNVNEPTQEDNARRAYLLSCRRCGKYEITSQALLDIDTYSPFLQAAARQGSEAGARVFITENNWRQLIEDHSHTGVAENFDKLLQFLHRRIDRPGKMASIDLEREYPVIDAQSSDELKWYLENAEDAGFIRKSGTHYFLTAKGWDYLIGPSGGGAIPGRCFVAMSFSEEHSSIYMAGIKPAVVDAGYDPIWMKDVLTNEDICHRMVVEIRKAQFVVADFTGQKGGVYFEAGFALALGRQVFWTTKAEEMNDIHFDTNHYQHVDWKTAADLRSRLTEKIVALLGYGPRHGK